jgi:nucleotide-binding universal stress UspA family protein
VYKKVLVPLDGFELAESILDHVREMIADHQASEVVLLTVVEGYDKGLPSISWGGVKYTERRATIAGESMTEAREYIEKIANDLEEEGVVVTPVVIQGKVAEEILDYAVENQVDLIMMCTHGRSGPSRWALGSIADRVIRHSPIPVLIVTPKGGRID